MIESNDLYFEICLLENALNKLVAHLGIEYSNDLHPINIGYSSYKLVPMEYLSYIKKEVNANAN